MSIYITQSERESFPRIRGCLKMRFLFPSPDAGNRPAGRESLLFCFIFALKTIRSMTMGKLLPILILILIGMSVCISAEESPRPIPNCEIQVISIRKSGEQTKEVFQSHEPSRQACEKAARLYRTNFAPHAVAKKIVSVRWRGSK